VIGLAHRPRGGFRHLESNHYLVRLQGGYIRVTRARNERRL